MALTVPTPTIAANGAAGTVFSAATPITVACAPVAFDDGTLLTPDNAAAFGYRLYRQPGAGAVQVWDEAGKQWVAESAAPEAQSLFYQDDQWQTILVAVGQKDAANAPKLETNRITHFPRYFVRCFFEGQDAAGVQHTGESAPTPQFEVVALGETDRAGLATVPEEVDAATEIYLYLKDSGLTERGVVRIYRDGSGYAIDLDVSGARITLDRQGDITLRPASGRTVRIDGDAVVTGDLNVVGLLTP